MVGDAGGRRASYLKAALAFAGRRALRSPVDPDEKVSIFCASGESSPFGGVFHTMALGPDTRFTTGAPGWGRVATADAAAVDAGLRSYMLRVYNWICLLYTSPSPRDS